MLLSMVISIHGFRVLSTLISIFFLAGCATVQTCSPIPLPPRPDLPTLTPEQDAAIPQDAYERLVERDVLQKTHIDRLRGIVNAHNRGCK